MAEYEITSPDGRKVVVAGNTPPTAEDVARIFAVLPAKKPSMMQRVRQAISPEREAFPEYIGGGTPEEVLASERQMADPNATLSQDRFGNPTLVSSRGTFYPNRPGLSVADISGFLRGTESVAKEAAPYIAGGIATAPARALIQTGTQGAIGLASEAINQAGAVATGDEAQWSKLATTPIFAMAGDLAGRLAYRVAAPVVAKIIGGRPSIRITNPDGTLTDDAIKLLRSSGTSADDFATAMAAEADNLNRTGVLTREQAERFNFMKSMGVEPTTAQITRTADDFQMQQELAKRSTTVRAALEEQEGAISQAFDTRILGAGGQTTGSPLSDAVVNRATALDSEISSLYQAAREAAPGAQNVRLTRYAEALRKRAPDNELTGGLIRSIRGDLVERGVIDNNFQVRGKIDVDTAETIRQVLNSRYNSTNDFGKQVIRELKDQLDDDVLSTAGRDVFQQARQARAEFGRMLRPERVSKFDINQRSLVEDIMDNTIKADDVFEKVALSNSWKPSDLNQLKRFLTTGAPEQIERGIGAWVSLRTQTLDYIRSEAFKGPIDASGNQAISRASLERAINRIGKDKMKVIFTSDEVKFLDDMMRLAQLREPVRGTALGRGPSAQAIERLERSVMSRLPVVGQMFDFAKALRLLRAESAATQQVLNPAGATVQQIGRALATPQGAAGAAGATGGISAYTGTENQPQR